MVSSSSGFMMRGMPFLGGGRLREEKERLEAFLAAMPGAYCGWSSGGDIAHSQSLSTLLGLERIGSLVDIQGVLSPGDAAALEGCFEQLHNLGTPFLLQSKTYDGRKIFKITGRRGQSESGASFSVLWFEDVSEAQRAYDELADHAREKEAYFRRLECAFDSILSPRWLRDKDGKLIWVNRTYTDVVGHTLTDIVRDQKELTGSVRKTQLKAKAAQDKTLLGPEQALKALETGEPQKARAHVNVGGQRLLMQILEIPMPELQMTLGVAEDISEQEEIQNRLARYQSSHRELLEQLRSAVAIYTADERLEFYNSAFAQLWRLEDGWLNTRPSLGEIMEKLRETRRLPEQADFRHFKQSWLSMFTALIDPHEEMLYLPDGSAVRMLVIPHSMGGLMMNFEDVTSRLELESSYNTLIAVQKETLDNLSEGVAVYGGDGRLKLWNPAFGRLWNLNPEDLDGEPHVNSLVQKMSGYFTPSEWPVRKDELVSKALDRMMHEGRLERADNSRVDFTTVPLPDGGVLVTYRDVTDTVRVENALREKNAALEAAEQLKLDFLANVSYQLRTPLNAIMGFNELLDQEYFGKLNERQHQYTRDIHAASEKLMDLVNDILDLSTLEAGYMSLQSEDIPVYEMMQNINDLVASWARSDSVSIQMKCAKNIGKITADRRRLKQVMINLIRNAINFTPEGGTIEFSAKR
ncbi:MAG: PAS-domain containing protein, partial [Alphaproteobacteria bacterium]|nr:PAS-domain containing protein [Alphaproteobacteria bacterium]